MTKIISITRLLQILFLILLLNHCIITLFCSFLYISLNIFEYFFNINFLIISLNLFDNKIKNNNIIKNIIIIGMPINNKFNSFNMNNAPIIPNNDFIITLIDLSNIVIIVDLLILILSFFR